MSTDKTQLLQLIEFVKDISNKPGNEWFVDELIKKIGINNNSIVSDHFSSSFIKLQRLTFKSKGTEFYKSIKNQDLRNELVKDYVEMLWFKMVNLVDRYFLFLYYQAENMLNYYITKTGAFNKVKIHPESYKIAFNEKFIVSCNDYFFNKSGIPNDLQKINSIWAKIVYWAIESNNSNWLIKNKTIIDTLINARNFNSHRNSQQANEKSIQITKNQIANYKKGDDIYVSYPLHFLKLLREAVRD